MATFNQEAFIEHLKSKWQGRACPMCGTGNWEVQQSVFEMREFNHGNFILGGPIVPVVPVTCKNCGNTVLVNALVSNVVQRPAPEKK